MRRGYANSERYCGNYLTKEVHDLLNTQNKCFIEDAIDSGEDIPFENLEIASKAGYSCCEHCLSVKNT